MSKDEKDNVLNLPTRESEEPDDNAIEADAPDEEIKSGKCYTTVTGGRIVPMLEIRIPIRENVIKRKAIPYSNMNEPEITQYRSESIISIVTDIGTNITIEGENLGRIFDAIINHKLKMIRPANEGETIGDGEPEPKKITIDENE